MNIASPAPQHQPRNRFARLCISVPHRGFVVAPAVLARLAGRSSDQPPSFPTTTDESLLSPPQGLQSRPDFPRRNRKLAIPMISKQRPGVRKRPRLAAEMDGHSAVDQGVEADSIMPTSQGVNTRERKRHVSPARLRVIRLRSRNDRPVRGIVRERPYAVASNRHDAGVAVRAEKRFERGRAARDRGDSQDRESRAV